MKLAELLGKTESMQAHCNTCGANTNLDPTFFFLRRGDVDLFKLAESLHCANCGSRGIELTSIPERL